MPGPVIVRDVSLRVADHRSATSALREISLELRAGEPTAVVGPAGSGSGRVAAAEDPVAA